MRYQWWWNPGLLSRIDMMLIPPNLLSNGWIFCFIIFSPPLRNSCNILWLALYFWWSHWRNLPWNLPRYYFSTRQLGIFILKIEPAFKNLRLWKLGIIYITKSFGILLIGPTAEPLFIVQYSANSVNEPLWECALGFSGRICHCTCLELRLSDGMAGKRLETSKGTEARFGALGRNL